MIRVLLVEDSRTVVAYVRAARGGGKMPELLDSLQGW